MTPSAAFDLHVSLRYKARDRYPIDPTEPTMVFDVTNLRYNYSKWCRFGTTSTKSRDFSWLHPEHVTGIPSTQWNPHNPTLGLRSPSSNAMLSSIVEYNLSCFNFLANAKIHVDGADNSPNRRFSCGNTIALADE